MNLYIFEPYSWAYCGGAIGVVANTFDKAVKMIVESNDNGLYKYKHFRMNTETFKEDNSNQWLLTHKIPVSPGKLPEILFSNWNDA